MYALCDINSFYASAHAVFRPDIRKDGIIVLSNNDGCIVAANRKAKELGIKKFSPYFQVKKQCEQLGLHVFSSNYELYSDLSSKFMQTVGQFAPAQHIYSIDETFLDLHRCFPAIRDFYAYGDLIRKTVWKECRLPICVGIGTTLTLAKLANHTAKCHRHYNGVCMIDNEIDRLNILKTTAVNDVCGIGKKISQRLESMDIKTAYQLATMPPKCARKNFNIEIERTVRELNGQICKTWDQVQADKKQIFSTRSLGRRITSRDELQQALAKHANIAARKARSQNSGCQSLLVFAGNSTHDDRPQQFKTIMKFARPTNCSTELTKATTRSLDKLFRTGVRYYKIGVGMLDLSDLSHEQYDLFNQSQNNPELMKVYDDLNDRFGPDTIYLTAQGQNQRWAMRREMLSPQYTTN
ncbi:Y-family DNA polymerase [Shewanella sp. 202IG2-18]|uniref:Y-family DNA polymerase n=1 Tax=Parashewanella hymeniacidonis TaxID=2807618 RepID=UPI0019612065|nr:Y-family DNA polymerase [Parashewanella hymeniacidonis]MBM7072651.1 Y-family DNA polymerase [Parashewanella hymeniacidonis]